MARRPRHPANTGLVLVIAFVAISWWLANQRPGPERRNDATLPVVQPRKETTATSAVDPCEPKIVEEFPGRVVHVQDGDSFKLQAGDRGTVTVRMKSIDAPEKEQRGGDAARSNLKRLIEGREVRIRSVGDDQYGRTLGYVVLGSDELNERLVRDGWAWHYFNDSCEERFAAAEREARRARRGVWQELSPEPPWEFRRAKREAQNRRK